MFDGSKAGMAERLRHQAVIMRDYGAQALYTTTEHATFFA
jgi:hypothetical protein